MFVSHLHHDQDHQHHHATHTISIAPSPHNPNPILPPRIHFFDQYVTHNTNPAHAQAPTLSSTAAAAAAAAASVSVFPFSSPPPPPSSSSLSLSLHCFETKPGTFYSGGIYKNALFLFRLFFLSPPSRSRLCLVVLVFVVDVVFLFHLL